MYDRDELLYHIALLYHEEENTQTQIAKQLGLSRPTVATMLKEARDKGIIKVAITPPSALKLDQANIIADKFNLQTVIISPKERSQHLSKVNVSKAAAQFIEERAFNLNSIGVGWGTTIFEMVQAMKPAPLSHLKIVPLMGGAGIDYTHLHSNHLAFRMAEKYQAGVTYYYAPAIADSLELKDSLEQSLFIQETKKKALAVDLAITGIGNPAVPSTYRALGAITEEEEEAIRNSGAVGDVLASFFDKKGRIVKTDLTQRMVGIQLDELEMMNEVCIIGSGRHKAAGILALLQKGCLDHLIIDQDIADYLLAKDY